MLIHKKSLHILRARHSIFVILFIPLFFAKPAIAQTAQLPALLGASCQSTVKAVETEMANKGYYVTFITKGGGRPGSKIQPSTEYDDLIISRSYYNYPPRRTRTILFSSLKDYPSDQLMASLGARIMAACPQVGLVIFADWYEGSKRVGYFPDNTARVFTWINYGGNDKKYKWGYYFDP